MFPSNLKPGKEDGFFLDLFHDHYDIDIVFVLSLSPSSSSPLERILFSDTHRHPLYTLTHSLWFRGLTGPSALS